MLYMLYSIYLSSFFLPSCLSKIIKVLRKSFCVQLLIERCELREFCSRNLSLATLDERGERGWRRGRRRERAKADNVMPQACNGKTN